MLYLSVKYVHVIGAAVLLGTGAGIALCQAIPCDSHLEDEVARAWQVI